MNKPKLSINVIVTNPLDETVYYTAKQIENADIKIIRPGFYKMVDMSNRPYDTGVVFVDNDEHATYIDSADKTVYPFVTKEWENTVRLKYCPNIKAVTIYVDQYDQQN